MFFRSSGSTRSQKSRSSNSSLPAMNYEVRRLRAGVQNRRNSTENRPEGVSRTSRATERVRKTPFSGIQASKGVPRAPWSALGALLGLSWGALGALLGALGALLGALGALLGALWVLLGRSWGGLGALLVAPGPSRGILDRFGGLWGSILGSPGTDFGAPEERFASDWSATGELDELTASADAAAHCWSIAGSLQDAPRKTS